jgi:hypothetical protein
MQPMIGFSASEEALLHADMVNGKFEAGSNN